MKIKALVLTLIMFLSLAVPTLAYESVSFEHSDFVASFLSDLGFDIAFSSETVSRGEFLHLVMKAMKTEVSAEVDGSFKDVDKTYVYAEDIYKAKLMGVVSGAQSNLFSPDAPITYNAALKILVSALGYKNTAEVYGGYPVGYSLVSNEIGLHKNVPAKGEGNLLREEAYVLLYNFLGADLCEMVSTDGTNSTTARQPGKTLLTEKYGLITYDGVIKSAGFISSSPAFYTDSSVIELNGDIYKNKTADAEKYIGLSAKVYVESETGTVRAIYPKTQNQVFEINPENVASYNDFTLIYEDGSQKNKTFMFDRGFYYIKNGRASKNIEFDFENGNIKLIDNNRDNLIDFAVVEKYDYMVVSSISATQNAVYDINAGKSICFLCGNGYTYDLEIDGEEKTYDFLTQGTVITYMKSDDERYVKAIGVNKSIKGKVEETGKNSLKINGEEYKVNTYFSENENVKPGFEGEFSLSHDGYITAVKTSGKNELRYGYLYGYFKKDKGLSSDVQIQLLDQGGQHIVYSLAKKITFDGEMIKCTDNRVNDALTNGKYPKYQVIKYAIDADGLVNIIDTSKEADTKASLSDKYNIDYTGNDSLTRFVKNKNSYFDTSNTFLPYTVSNSNTVIFSIPSALADINNQDETKEDMRNAYYDKKSFSLFSKSSVSSRVKILCDIYDQDKFMQSKVIVLYNKVTGSSGGVNQESTPKIVESICDAVDDEGYISKKLTILSGASYVSYFMDSELCEDLGEKGMPQSGDIIRISTNSAGELTGLIVDARYNFEKNEVEIINQAKDQVYYSYYTGKVFSHNSSMLALKVEKGPYMEPYYSDDTVDGVLSFLLPSNVYCIKYDTVRKTAVPVRSEDIEDILAVGEEKAANVLINSFVHNIRIMVEYVAE